jgi:hypothetical protein
VTNRLFYPSYAQEVPLANIVSRIKILLYKWAALIATMDVELQFLMPA